MTLKNDRPVNWVVRFATRQPDRNPAETAVIRMYSANASRFWRYEYVAANHATEARRVVKIHYRDAIDVQVVPGTYVEYLHYAAGTMPWPGADTPQQEDYRPHAARRQ